MTVVFAVDDYVKALLFALAPALGNVGGGFPVERFDVPRRILGFALHAAGVSGSRGRGVDPVTLGVDLWRCMIIR